MKKITTEEALNAGYTHYTIEQTEIYGTIEELINHGRPECYPNNRLIILGKGKIAFSFTDEEIHDILQDYILNQDDLYCEDDELCDELAEADFKKIAELVNVGFKKRFRLPTDIELILP